MHRNPETLTTLGSSGTKHLLTFFDFQFFDTRRERHNFYYADRFHLTQQNARRIPQAPTGLASPRLKKSTSFPWFGSQLTAFSKIHQNPKPIASWHDIIRIPVLFSIWGFYYDICDCHILRAASVNTCTQCVHLHAALSRIVLSLTKPNDKI